jgi:5-(carboxyamino)imidazole ribonucleotide mutase
MKNGKTLPRNSPRVAVIMGSSSDWETMKHACRMLSELGIPHEKRVISAHRTPDLLTEFTATAEDRGVRVIIAGAGGAAHLAGVTAAQTLLPVLGVPIQSKALQGLDSLLSIVQMPKGIPVGTLAIGEGGAANAALLAAQMLALHDPALKRRLEAFRREQARKVREAKL